MVESFGLPPQHLRDELPQIDSPKRKFTIFRDSFKTGRPICTEALQVYTDGSKTVSAKTGMGMSVLNPQEEVLFQVHSALEDQATVFKQKLLP